MRLPGSSGVARGAAYRNRTDDLRITRVSRCVARGFRARASFMFAGCCWLRVLAVDGSSGASRGHAPEVRRPSSRWVLPSNDRPFFKRSGLPVRLIRSKRGRMLSCVSGRDWLPTLLSAAQNHWIAPACCSVRYIPRWVEVEAGHRRVRTVACW
jgi:hypothetical protein